MWPVYPHVCGATNALCKIVILLTGLSPRVWGNPHGSGCFRTAERSIPTCVGQPTHAFLTVQADEVYPHVCGATLMAQGVSAPLSGLSPRVWGNPLTRF